MEDYFSGEMQEINCIKCGKKQLKLVCSVADRSMHAVCDNCKSDMALP